MSSVAPINTRTARPISVATSPFRNTRPERAEEEGTARLIPLLNLKSTDVVADIGAGSGYFSFRLAKAVPDGKVTILPG